MSSTILSNSGLPLRAFGGPDAWKVYESGDYMVSIETVEGEPACVLWPKLGDINAGAYAVCLSAFPYWLHEDGRPTQQAWTMARTGLERMGREVTLRELVAVMSVVIDAYPWVARMPPKKAGKRDALYEATAQVNGKTLHEREV